MQNSDRRPASADEAVSGGAEKVVRGLSSIAPALARLSIIGWYVALSISGGAILGWWLDGIIGSKPLLLVCGVLLGVAVAMVGMVRMLNRLNSKD